MSEDVTRGILAGYSEKYPFIRLLDNRKRITPCAFNIGIRHARGEAVMIMGMHATYERDYISKCVSYLDEYGADNVGGVMVTVPRDSSLAGKAIAKALSHRFGVGNSVFRTGTKEPVFVDTVFGGCYKKEVFRRVGMFNEALVKHQDMEFNCRLRDAGGRILLAPDIVCYYYARTDIRSFLAHNWGNGLSVHKAFSPDGLCLGHHFFICVFGFILGLCLAAACCFWFLFPCGVLPFRQDKHGEQGSEAISGNASGLCIAAHQLWPGVFIWCGAACGVQALLVGPRLFGSTRHALRRDMQESRIEPAA
jgi:hypothetical protein